MKKRFFIVAVILLATFAAFYSFAGFPAKEFFGKISAITAKTVDDLFKKEDSGNVMEITLEDDNESQIFDDDGGTSGIFIAKPVAAENPAKEEKILLSEIFYDSGGSDVGKEFIELYNSESFSVDLSGWVIKKDGTTIVSLGSGSKDKTEITSGGYFLIGLNKWNNLPQADAVRSASLPNESAKIELLDAMGNLRDFTSYNRSVLEGESLERVSWSGGEFKANSLPSPQNSGL